MPRSLLLSPSQVVDAGLCIGCGSCAAQQSPDQLAMQMDRFGLMKPVGTGQALQTEPFTRTCPFSPAARDEDQLASAAFPDAPPHPLVGRFLGAYVGYAAEGGFREGGSSGGMVSWILAELLRAGLVDAVAHVRAADPSSEGGFFRYSLARTEEEVRSGARSRYYPVELSEVLRTIRETPGRYAIVGVPCFIKAVQLLRQEDPLVRERVAFTVGLFCGHMKSARFVESFAWQLGVPLDQVQAVEFRLKDPNRPASTYTAQLTLRDGSEVRRDWWNLADGDWGAGFFQASACNFCDDVVAETADISLGDAWVEPYSSDGRGTNVAIVRSPIVHKLIASAMGDRRLQLDAVDDDFIVRTQAAGFRQRREGLAYRLSHHHSSLHPRKRVRAGSADIAPRRKLIYRLRSAISAWSHRVAWLAHQVNRGRLYVGWARVSLATYHEAAYSRGRFSDMIRRLRGWIRR